MNAKPIQDKRKGNHMTENRRELSMEDAIREAAHTMAELARSTREMMDTGAAGYDCIRRNCETICAGLRDLAEAIKHS